MARHGWITSVTKSQKAAALSVNSRSSVSPSCSSLISPMSWALAERRAESVVNGLERMESETRDENPQAGPLWRALFSSQRR